MPRTREGSQPEDVEVIHPADIRLSKRVFPISLGSRREQKNCCVLATTKDGGQANANAMYKKGVLSSPTLGRRRGDHIRTNSLVLPVASVDVVPVVTARPPASAGGLATFSSSCLATACSATAGAIARGRFTHHFGHRCLGSPIGADRRSQIVMRAVNQALSDGLSSCGN